MGFLGIFKKKNIKNTENILIGYFRTEISELIGHEVKSKKYNEACESAGKLIKTLVPLLNKEQQQKVYNTIASACPSRTNEAFGEYMILLFTRYALIQQAISEGLVTENEASLEKIVEALHKEIQNLVAST